MDRSVAPQNISPLIKGARWSLLIAGIIYGNARYWRLYHKEQLKKEEWERTRPEREARQKAQKEKDLKEQMEQLSRDLGQQI